MGREQELEEIRELLGRSELRLLTLTGIGGVGKTRLALAAAREAEDHFADGAAFVDLAPLRDPVLVVPTIAKSLGLREGESAADALRAHLQERRTLLVLDNFEHLLEAAAEVVHLIEACPGLVVLATSRAPLRVRGEQEYPVPPLELPSSIRNPTEEKVLRTPSGWLFLERARAASPSFALTTKNAGTVAAICWRLGGLPLALELAAAKVRLLEPAALLPRLDQALSMAWARDLPERQRTMRATLDWSHELLSEPERKLFRRLAVFVGSFTLEAAEVVGASEEPEEVLDFLGALVEQSLVVVQPPKAEGETRYGMLEPVRQYAQELLEESGETGDVHREHAEVFLALAERAQPELMGERQVEWMERLEQENGNLHAAMSWALGTGEVETVARLGWALWPFWWVRGHQREGRRWMEVLLGLDPPATFRAVALLVAGQMAYAQGDYEACKEYTSESLELAREVGDTARAAHAVHGLGLLALNDSDLEMARSRLKEALNLHLKSGGSEQMLSAIRTQLGTVLHLQGDLDGAAAMMEEGLEVARRWGDRVNTYAALYNLAQVALARGVHDKAATLFEEGVKLSQEMRDQANLAYFLERLAVIAGARGEAGRSARLFGASTGSLEEVGASVYNYYKPVRSLYERTWERVRSRLGQEAFDAAWGEGREMIFEQAVVYALVRGKASSE